MLLAVDGSNTSSANRVARLSLMLDDRGLRAGTSSRHFSNMTSTYFAARTGPIL